MFNPEEIMKRLFQISSLDEFNDLALKIFHFQYHNCPVYQLYVKNIGVNPDSIQSLNQIPFLPISFFKHHYVYSSKTDPEITFVSSGTTGTEPGKHYIANVSVYDQSFTRCFEMNYGETSQYCILALLPSYLEREGSSLVFMLERLIDKSGHPDSGFYLYDTGKLMENIGDLKRQNSRIMLFGVSFALLDFAEQFKIDLSDSIIIETGGMKGRKEEMVREELHHILCESFNVEMIHSEYGMTELMSQAYSEGQGLFISPPWMKVMIRDVNDPFELIGDNKTGGINVIDLANIHSCSFIATEDLGRTKVNGSFEVLGRFDSSDIRGCSLLVI